MIDFNHRPKVHDLITAHIDAALTAERNKETRRTYLGASRLGVACDRALQFEFAGAPADPGRDFSGRVLRIFEVGHVLEDLAIRWLQMSSFDLHTRTRSGGQFGFSVCDGLIQGHVDGIVMSAPADLGWSFPMLWECKTMNAQNWRDCVKRGVAVAKPVYAAQMAVYQAYMESTIDGISRNPALFTAINKDTQELWFELVPFDGVLAQRSSDRAVKIIAATEHAELLPRSFNDSTHYECKFCSWAERCWRLTI
jgi:hypothetical protein